MKKSVLEASFTSSKRDVWNMMTDNTKWEWRRDLSHIQADGKRFTEYSQNLIPTYFVITEKDYEAGIYAFDLYNQNISGNWSGVFYESENGGCRVVFTESINVKNALLRFFAKYFMNISKIQQEYVDDLRKALGESSSY